MVSDRAEFRKRRARGTGREPLRRLSPYNQHRQSKQQGRQQPERCQRNGRSSHHLPG
ncbi:hypothetical protein TNCV_5007551, partial [Trichonephila clavipes]